MKLYYYPLPNFGDQPLNTWLWPRLLPTQLRDDDPTLLVGIGTLLNDSLPRQPRKAIFSAGAGYSQVRPDATWRVYCVRGPASARRLGLAPETAITDGAVLVRTLGLPAAPKTQRVAYMPHWRSDHHGHWERICQQANIHYINPLAGVDPILHAIQSSELILTEALHGAIVADAFRVPWVAVKAYPRILEFKWQDWCASVGLPYHPARLPAVYGAHSLAEQLHRRLSGRIPDRLEAWLARLALAAAAPLLLGRRQQAAEALGRLPATARPLLSADRVIDRVTTQLLEKLEQLKRELNHTPGALPGALA